MWVVVVWRWADAPLVVVGGCSNGYETDKDCGGPNCDGCPNNKYCQVASDCASNYCEITSGEDDDGGEEASGMCMDPPPEEPSDDESATGSNGEATDDGGSDASSDAGSDAGSDGSDISTAEAEAEEGARRRLRADA